MTRVFQFIIILLLSSTPDTILGQVSSQQLKEYIELNNAELRLPDFKDSELDLKLKLDQLLIINMSRNKYRANPVKLDILASRVANKMCREAAENGFTGHWNLAGEKPYHRYAFAGGLDHISENASGETTNGIFSSDPKDISTMMVNNHGAFMSEKRPNDGHKQTVIDRNHNYVGLGFYVTDHETRYYELYIDRYLRFNNVPSRVKANETFILECSSPENLFINLVLAYYEPYLKPMTPRRISTRSSYNDYSDVIALEVPPWEIIKYKEGDWYKIPISFKKTGLYYIHIYADNKPYKVGTTYSSENSLQASGIVIEVVK